MISKFYQQQIKKYSRQLLKNKKKLTYYAIGRLITFVLILFIVIKVLPQSKFLGFLGLIALIILFIFLIVRYLKIKSANNLTRNLKEINTNEIEALRGNCSNFANGGEFDDHEHEFCHDLEFFEEKGVFQFLNRTVTYSGKNILATWLKDPLKQKTEISKNQKFIAEISEIPEWRQKYLAIGQLIEESKYRDTELIAWANEENYAYQNKIIQIARWILPLLTLACIFLFTLNIIPLSGLLLDLLLNIIVLLIYQKKTKEIHQKISRQIKPLKNYRKLLEEIEKTAFKSEKGREFQESIKTGNKKASKIIHNLASIAEALDARSNFIVGTLFNGIFLWEIQHACRLEKWHILYAKKIEKWIHIIGQTDAFISLANFKFNNPGFVFPKISSEHFLEAKKIGHPLIKTKKRVNNDFSINKNGEIFIITGGNLAGKSTFLRTLGVNTILGLIGAPVCAAELKLNPVNIFTSMKINDSLHENESYFFAEIKRLRSLVDKASDSEFPYLVLLDEILTGTNTKDKEQASVKFVERLLQMNITTVIATHDLSLTKLENDFPEKITNNSFEVSLEKGQMSFDYKLKKGIAKNMNALQLLKDLNLI
jgi:DNA mismatch repair ATPase MutS